jgi:putative membrane-bound dehydrogenase-like protein
MQRTTIPSLLLAGIVLSAFSLHAAVREEISFPPHTFNLPEGYTLTSVAATPLVERPIHMCFDDEGALYVTDSSGDSRKAPVQVKDPTHRIRRLVDRDGDGVFDHSTVYAENVPFPEGVLVYQGAVYVGAPPHIWKFTDTDGDHVADERVSWFNGGSVDGCGNDMHGPYLAPDGYFYWTKGGFQEQSLLLGGGERHSGRAAHIFRAKPDGSEMEVVITGGMNNPVGLAFSESGERFLSGTFFDLSKPGRRDGILHAVYGGMYGRRNDRVLAQHPHTGDLLPILAQMGPAAPSGILMPRNNILGVKGDLLCADFNLRRISRHRLSRSGSSFSVETDSFLESDQTDFHPTDVIEDADGSLLVADTGSWYHICCPTSKSSKPQILGAIYRIQKTNSTALKDPRGLALDWNNPTISYLSDKRPVVVNRAIDALAKADNIDALRLSNAELPATWALHRIPVAEARKTIRDRVVNGSTDVRAAAIHSAALWRDAGAVEQLIDTLTAKDAQLRRLAAMALGRIGDRKAVKALFEAGAKEQYKFLKHAITYALFEIGDIGIVAKDHPLGEQLRQMAELDRPDIVPHSMPEIRLADPVDPDPEKLAHQQARLTELTKYLPKGDPKRGKKLFYNTAKSLCITCHVLGDRGVEFGPDLTGIGSIRSEQDLLEAIVFPSASIARYYEMVSVETEKDQPVGLILRDAFDHITFSAAPGVEQAIAIKNIKKAQYSNVSLMPEVFDVLLKPEEIANLVAYLKTETLPGTAASTLADEPASKKGAKIPAHQPVKLPGLHAYAQKSIAAGDEIEFRVSSSVPYGLSVVQLGADPENRDEDPVLNTVRMENPISQPIHPGSYVHVSKGLPTARRLTEFTLEGWIRPFSLEGWQGLITQHDYPEHSGVGLFLNNGRIAFMTGTGGSYQAATLHQTDPGLIHAQNWHHIVASWDGEKKRIYVDGELAGEFPFVGMVRPGQTALRLGAYGNQGVAANFYNGDLAMCVIHSRALDEDQIQQRFADQGLTAPKVESVLGCWPFTEERGTRVTDASSDGRHGQIINRGTWMIGGPSFDAAAIDRHDAAYDPTKDPKRGHGLRLAADELYNARWEVSHRFRVPADAKSGVYAGRFDFEMDGKPMRYFTTFIVRRPESRPKAPLLVLVSSNTWLAYNSAPFPVNHGRELTMMGTGGLATTHPNAATYSGYRDHHAGQPTYKIGLKLPWPAAGPNKTYINLAYSHLLRGERFLHLWLGQHGYEYDVVTDYDLDRNPEMLEGYQAVVLNGHSEYWSVPAYEGLDNYLKAGGAAVVMSGNTMFWRVSFDDSGEVMEVRKFGTGIGGRQAAQVGELYHSHDFKRGSLMRFCGYPAWKMVGLTCIGWGQEFKPYRVDQPDHFLFNQPHNIGLEKGETFGFISEDIGAVGHEFDVRLSTLQRATADPVIHGLVEPDGIVTVASSHHQRSVLDFNAEGHQARVGDEDTIAEIIYWERPEGGRVFHTGSIATAWGVYHDENLSKLVRNVLHHFGVTGEGE